MYCPKCGNPDQQPETFCRRCGSFLPDLNKPAKKKQTPVQHATANTVLSAMTIVVSFTLAGLLYGILGFRPETHWLIYATAGMLIAIGAWHIQTLWRSLLIRKHLKQSRPVTDQLQPEPPIIALEPADFENIVPASVVERTTRNLKTRSPKT